MLVRSLVHESREDAEPDRLGITSLLLRDDDDPAMA